MFGVLWIGVVVFASIDAPKWTRIGQVAFGAFLMGWALYKASVLLRLTRKAPARHRRVKA
ncbi:hypothetical protein [Streptosporangium sp. NPDC000396]|uniref:hypothetical protein n=1 Tax=Streptosporangium sp. NPDC000396 TaxID=3366185 RepID=UPI0036CE04FA